MTTQNKKQLFFDTLNLKNQTILASIWHHFLPENEQIYGYQDDRIIQKTVAAQKQFFVDNTPDFVKIMSDAFIIHPSILNTEINCVEDFNKIESVGPDHPWITKQVAAVKEIVSSYDGQIAALYNIFSPAYFFRIKFDVVDKDLEKFPRLVEEAPDLFAQALAKITSDVNILVDKLFSEAKINGIYLCVQSVQSPTFGEANYRQYIEPSQVAVLNNANRHSPYNVLHLCGFEGRINNLTHFANYPFKAVNWASYVENIPLDEGKLIFPNKAILGGFNNTTAGALYQGDRAAIEKETRALIAKVGKKGLLLGADCSVPADIDFENLKYTAKIANSISNQ